MRDVPRRSSIFRPVHAAPPASRLHLLTLIVLIGFGMVAWQLTSLARGLGPGGARIVNTRLGVRTSMAPRSTSTLKACAGWCSVAAASLRNGTPGSQRP